MMKHVIFGAGSLADLAHFYMSAHSHIYTDALVVDDEYLQQAASNDRSCKAPVLAWSAFTERFPPQSTKVFIAVGYKSMRARASAYEKVRASGYAGFNIVAEQAYIAKNVLMGDNNFVMPGAVIEPFVSLGDNNIVWSNATLCHNTNIGHHNFFACNATIGGQVSIGDKNFFGFSSTVIQNIHVQNETLIAAGSLVIENPQAYARYQGVPAQLFAPINPSIGVTV